VLVASRLNMIVNNNVVIVSSSLIIITRQFKHRTLSPITRAPTSDAYK